MDKICVECNEHYFAGHSNQKYCSRKCYINHMRTAKQPKLKYIDLKQDLTDADMETIWTALITYQEATKKLSTRQDEISIEIPTTEPIYITVLADAHIGAIQTRFQQFRDTIEAIASSPNTFMISCGDTVDNYLPSKHSEGQFEAMCPPEIQKRLLEYMYSKLSGRILALIQGDHDEFSHYADDFDWTKHLCEKFKCANLGFGGFINLKVGQITYKIHARHRYRFSSSLNLTHTVKRMREQVGDFHIGIVAHNHQAAIEYVQGQDGVIRVFIRPGSFKGADRYARRIGFVDCDCRSMMPTIELFPDRRAMNVYGDISYLTG